MNAWLAGLLVALTASTASAQSWLIVGADRYFRVEWATTATAGDTLVDGYIYNISGTAADRMRLLAVGALVQTPAELVEGSTGTAIARRHPHRVLQLS